MKTKLIASVVVCSVIFGFGAYYFYSSRQVQNREREAVCKTLQPEFGRYVRVLASFDETYPSIFQDEMDLQQFDKENFKNLSNLPIFLKVRKELMKHHADFPKGMDVSMVNSAGLLDLQYNDAWKQGVALAENLGYAICLDI